MILFYIHFRCIEIDYSVELIYFRRLSILHVRVYTDPPRQRVREVAEVAGSLTSDNRTSVTRIMKQNEISYKQLWYNEKTCDFIRWRENSENRF